MLLASLTLVAVGAASEPATLDLATVLRAARPAPERLAVESELAAAARELSLSRGILLEGPTLGVEAGPRRSPEGDDSDVAIGVDLPLAADRAERRAALEAHRSAARDLPAAAEVEGSLALRLAYVDAWVAGETRRLSEREVEAAVDWLAAVEARVLAGADAPYETALVAAELGVARLALADARERERVGWSALRARTAVDVEPVRLAAPYAAETDNGGAVNGSSLLVRAITARAELERSLLALAAARDGSRWSLGGAVAQEGEEEVAHLGLGYRLPLAGQSRARATALEAALAERARRTELELASLEGTLAGAHERLAALSSGAAISPEEVDRALAALDARLAAGRDRPSEVLPLRRQLLGALLTELEARAARFRAAFQIDALTTEIR